MIQTPSFWVIIAAVVVCIIVAGVLLTNPEDKKEKTPDIIFPVDTYVYEECIFMNPLSSYRPFEGTGELYKLSETNLTILNLKSGEITQKCLLVTLNQAILLLMNGQNYSFLIWAYLPF